MKKLSVSGLVLAAFLVGCAAAMVAAPIVVPPVRAGTSPAKWEYDCASTKVKEITATANKFGPEGWEMVNFAPSGGGWARVCFKRPL